MALYNRTIDNKFNILLFVLLNYDFKWRKNLK